MCAVALRHSFWSIARQRRLQNFDSWYIEPCDPTLRENPPRGDDWVYEIKADGYRAQLQSAKLLRANRVIIDSETVVYGSGGLPDFQQPHTSMTALRQKQPVANRIMASLLFTRKRTSPARSAMSEKCRFCCKSRLLPMGAQPVGKNGRH
jgi:hypothetical protein